MSEQIRNRSEIETKYQWDLSVLYPSVEAWRSDLRLFQQMSEQTAAYRGKVCSDAQSLLSYMELSEQLWVLADKLGNFAMRRSDEDTREAENQALCGQYTKAAVRYSEQNSFLTPELLAVSDDDFEQFYRDEPKLELYRRHFAQIRAKRKHILPAEQEALLAMAGEFSRTPGKVFSLFSDADLVFPDAIDSDGKPHTITQGTYVPCLESTDRVLRKNAFESCYKTYDQFKNTCAGLLNSQVQKLQFYADARGYASSLEASLDNTEVPVSVYHSLIDTVHKHMDKFYRYVRLRKKILGIDDLHFYDLYTPLTGESSAEISYEEAKSTVLDALSCMGERYTDLLREGFNNRWIDVYENVGKRSGAYSAGTPVHPFVLLNHKDNLDGIFTIAHEMGHAIHSYLSVKHQPVVYSDYVIFVAEVASTCNEALLMQYLLRKTTDRTEKMRLLNYFLEQFKGTLFRQTMFAEFELKIAELNQSGTPLTAQTLIDEYRKLIALYFGDDIILDEQIALEWAKIPHFYYNYYVFQYATGYAAAIALSEQILQEGKPAVERYLRFLSGGCSKPPIDLLRDAGVDMATSEPVEQALELFGRLLDEMEQLQEELNG